ncbi:nitroreductase [Maricaulis sp. D1M11]|uniref:nitroreductase family protein n=1 Tax=Maricaulis sp. D1M11 TaxID=3076117 RepID=UPI0039B5C8F7
MDNSTFTRRPEFGERLEASHKSEDTLTLLTHRRSTAAIGMTDPGPTADERDLLLQIGARVPDHGKLAPWRFVIFEGETRTRFGSELARIFRSQNPEATDEQVAFEANRFNRAPLVIAVISRVDERHKVPVWEQELSAGAVCQNLLIGASALGYAAQWLTEWYAFDQAAKHALGLQAGERVAGFIYVGTAKEQPVERARPGADIRNWTPA